MAVSLEPRRVLVVADASAAPSLHELFTTDPLDSWEHVAADSLLHAGFLLQHQPCDILLVDESVYVREGAAAFAWLARRRGESSLVVLTESAAEAALRAYSHGVTIWLPRELVLRDPQLLAVALNRAACICQLQQERRRLEESLQQSRRQIDRLIRLLWRTLPLDAERRWFSQRHMLERLQEEITRSQRYGTQLTVALGEVEVPIGPGPEEAALADWAAEKITSGKRRCDVAGQYGLRGFLLLMVNTPTEGGLCCCRRLQQSIEQGLGPHAPLRAYFGLASLSAEVTSPQSLLRRAEERLEAARADEHARLAAEPASA